MPASRPIPSLRAALLLGLAAVLLGGCAGKRGAKKPHVEPAEDASAPVVRGVESGLEAHLWVVENRSGVLAAALREFGPPLSASPSQIDIWRQSGFRVLEVPLERLDAVRDAMPTIGPLHRQWLGLLPEWVEVVKGARLDDEHPVRLDSGAVHLGPGRLRLLTRCWAMPQVGAMPDGSAAGAIMRVEVMPELEMSRPGDPFERMLGDAPITPRSGVRGLVFDRMILGVVASGSAAIVIVPEDPGIDWAAEAPGRPESHYETLGQGVRFGPKPPVVPTLGELMLTSLALPESAGDARIVVVLAPRVPERFELLPR